jgi:hypothetical protein
LYFYFHGKYQLTNALYAIFIQCIALVALAAETTNCILTATIAADPWEFCAFINILPIYKATSFGAQFLMSLSSWTWTRLTSAGSSVSATPGFAHRRATAHHT